MTTWLAVFRTDTRYHSANCEDYLGSEEPDEAWLFGDPPDNVVHDVKMRLVLKDGMLHISRAITG